MDGEECWDGHCIRREAVRHSSCSHFARYYNNAVEGVLGLSSRGEGEGYLFNNQAMVDDMYALRASVIDGSSESPPPHYDPDDSISGSGNDGIAMTTFRTDPKSGDVIVQQVWFGL